MKCVICIDDIYKRIKRERGKLMLSASEKADITAQMSAEIAALPDAVTANHGGSLCLTHYMGIAYW